MSDEKASTPIEVLVADDSPTVRRVMRHLLEADPRFRVVAESSNGLETVERARRLKPGLITMDVQMPGIDGLEATRRIMHEAPTPIVIVSALAGRKEAKMTFDAVAAGAVHVMAKPDYAQLAADHGARGRWLGTLAAMADVHVIRRRRTNRRPRAEDKPARFARLIAIGASTGGPPVIKHLLEGLSPRHAPPVLITQHMSHGFTLGFATWLNRAIDVEVGLARAGAKLREGHVYIAPDDAHLELNTNIEVVLSRKPPLAHHRPAIDPLFESVARVAGVSSVAVLLTGMGSDGARGLAALRRAGTFTVVQDPGTAAAPSMPTSAIDLDAGRMVAEPSRIAEMLANLRAFRR